MTAVARGVTLGSRWRHKKRGSSYVITGVAFIQVSGTIKDGDMVVIYEDEGGGKHVRGRQEFLDGRFERMDE